MLRLRPQKGDAPAVIQAMEGVASQPEPQSRTYRTLVAAALGPEAAVAATGPKCTRLRYACQMPLKHELSALLRRRIEEMGLDPRRLAELSRVQPEKVRALLAAGEPNVSIAEAESIANAVGLALGVFGHHKREGTASAFDFAAQTASTSFRHMLPATVLRQTLLTGEIPDLYRAHVRTLLDEAPVGILARLADEVNEEVGTSQSATWQIMRQIARQLACGRELWQ